MSKDKEMPTEPQKGPRAASSQRKLKGLAKLEGLAAKISDGTDYNLQQYILAEVTLEQVRRSLSDIRGSLADTVTDERTH